MDVQVEAVRVDTTIHTSLIDHRMHPIRLLLQQRQPVLRPIVVVLRRRSSIPRFHIRRKLLLEELEEVGEPPFFVQAVVVVSQLR